MAHFSGLPQRRPNDTYRHIIRRTYTIHPDDQEDQTTLINVSSEWLTQYIRMINICHPDTMARIIDWSKRVLHAITTTNHGPRPITCRVKGRVEVTTSHFPRSFYMITSHDLWQPLHLPRFLTAARRVAMTMLPPYVIITTQNISSSLMRGTVPLTLYINLHTKRNVISRYLVKGQLIYISLSNHG